MFDITNQLLTRHAFRAFCATLPCWRINSKALTILNPMFSRIMAASKTLKNWIRIAYRHCRSKLPRRGRRPNWREEKPKVTYSVALIMDFSWLRTEIDFWKIATSRFWLCTWKPFFLSLRKKSVTENFVNWKLCPLFVSVMIQHIFHLEPFCQRTLRLYFWDCGPYFFHPLIKTSFFVSKGLFNCIVLKIIHGCM